MQSIKNDAPILFIKAPSIAFEKVASLSLRSKLSEDLYLPFGICYLIAAIRNSFDNISVYDPHLDCCGSKKDDNSIQDEIRLWFAALKPNAYKYVCISSQFLIAYQWTHYLAKLAKEAMPDCTIIVGGGHPSILQEKVLEDQAIDFVLIGEAESSLLDLLRCLEDQAVLTGIDGLCYRDGNQICKEEKTEYLQDLDTLAFPAWDAVDTEKYMRHSSITPEATNRTLPIITSRGCPFSCTFCNTYKSWGRRFRKRSADNILAEIDYLVREYQIDDVLFVDDNMTLDKQRMLDLLMGIEKRGLSWSSVNMYSGSLDRELLEAMVRTGCKRISISVESAAPKTLKLLRKPLDLNHTREVIRLCRELGLWCSMNFIVGLPYDTKADMETSFSFAEDVGADWNVFSMLVPYPGTDIYDYCVDNNFLSQDSLQLENLNQRNLQLSSSEWSKEWVETNSYDWNIRLNFLGNPNLVQPNGNISMMQQMLEYIVEFHPTHLIAAICLAYLHHRTGNFHRERLAQEKAIALITDEKIMEIYAKYLAWDKYDPIQYYHDISDSGRE